MGASQEKRDLCGRQGRTNPSSLSLGSSRRPPPDRNSPAKPWENENTQNHVPNVVIQRVRCIIITFYSYSGKPAPQGFAQPSHFIRPRTTRRRPIKTSYLAGPSVACNLHYRKNLLVFRRGRLPRRPGQPAPWGPSQSPDGNRSTRSKGSPPGCRDPEAFFSDVFLSLAPLDCSSVSDML